MAYLAAPRSVPIAIVGTLIATSPAIAQITMSEQTAGTGLVAVHAPDVNAIPGGQERMTGGMTVADFNRDGYQDVFWIGGGLTADKLFINDGDGTFTDEAAAWGVDALHCGNAAAAADYDGDGWVDMYVTSFGPPGDPDGAPGYNRLYHNNGDGTFTEVAVAAGVNVNAPTDGQAFGAAWGDYDLDGHLDLFVTSWLTAFGQPAVSDGNRLFRNLGNGTFQDVTAIALDNDINHTRGFQPVFADMNFDLYPELLIAADWTTSKYYVNNGDGTFTNFSAAAGIGLDENGMGTAIADWNRDGIWDWYVSSIFYDNPAPGYYRGNMLYVGTGGDVYEEKSVTAGCNDGGWSWGVVPADLDHDGWEEIISVNGWAPGAGDEFDGERAKLFHNQGPDIDGVPIFSEIAAAAGLDSTDIGRSIVYIDVENDGDLDLLITNRYGPLHCFRNDTPSNGNWIRIFLDTTNNDLLPPDGFNTRVIATVGGETQQRYMSAAPGYLGTSEHSIHFGFGSARSIDELRFEWSRGQVSIMTDVAVNQHITVPSPPLGDIDGNGSVGTSDLLAMLAEWGAVNEPSDLAIDLNNDGVISTADLLLLLSLWG